MAIALRRKPGQGVDEQGQGPIHAETSSAARSTFCHRNMRQQARPGRRPAALQKQETADAAPPHPLQGSRQRARPRRAGPPHDTLTVDWIAPAVLLRPSSSSVRRGVAIHASPRRPVPQAQPAGRASGTAGSRREALAVRCQVLLGIDQLHQAVHAGLMPPHKVPGGTGA